MPKQIKLFFTKSINNLAGRKLRDRVKFGQLNKMDFTLNNLQESISSLSRRIGYVIIDTKPNGEYNLVRKLAFQNFPRFHVYLTQQGNNLIFSLHLDQKAPVYQGSHAHNGEYFGPVVESEGDRIKNILATND